MKKGMRVLVTGGAGFIGSHLVDRLMKDPGVKKVTVVDNLSTGKRNNVNVEQFDKGEFIYGNLYDTETAKIATQDIDVVFHLAATSSTQDSLTSPLLYHLNGDHMTLVLLDAALKAGVPNFIFASSASVYKSSYKPISETMIPIPLSPYAVYKLNSENYLRIFSLYGMKTVSLRFFNVYGPRQVQGVVPKLCQSFLQHKPFPINGNGEQSRDFIYVSDVVEACIKAMHHPQGFQGHRFNIGTGKSTSVKHLIEIFNHTMKCQTKKVWVNPLPNEIQHSQADIRLAMSMLEWSPTISLQEGIRMTFEYWFDTKKEKE